MGEICVLGTGMAAYGAAHRFVEEGLKPVLFDKQSFYGGHTATHCYEGKYTFDEGPHVSFTKNERIQKLLAHNVNHEYHTLHARVNNYWKGYWVKHPAQVNLHGLPTDVIVKVIKDFVAAQNNPPARIDNYEQWLRASFGNTFAEEFPMRYTVKYHTTEAKNLSTDWMGPRLYQAKLEEVLMGALAPAGPEVHYVTHVRYPLKGGFMAYLRPFMERAERRMNHRLIGIDPHKRELKFENGNAVTYKHIVSSIPLPDLIPAIKGAPKNVVEAASRLACSDLVIVNLVIDRPEIIDAHWTYFYDEEFVFSRLSTPHLQSASNVPPGCGSLQAEIYFSKKYRPLTGKSDDFIEPVIKDLRRCGLLKPEDKILLKNTMHIEYANVIFDLERASALATVHAYLDEIGVHYCGRFGDWGYIWTDQAFESGEKAAQKALAA
ncbi:MAG TPA: NAD(P)-binding protein [Verrucomicrobiae bacterium]|nr:NAD(P)-binding protein [Verrucomicrobiae bacterium]